MTPLRQAAWLMLAGFCFGLGVAAFTADRWVVGLAETSLGVVMTASAWAWRHA